MEENVTYHFNKKELKKQTREWNRKKKIHKIKNGVKNFFDENGNTIKEIALPIIVTGLATGVANIPKMATKAKSDREKYDNRRTYYGWELRRPLSNRERQIVQERHAAGERLGDIFESMGLLR